MLLMPRLPRPIYLYALFILLSASACQKEGLPVLWEDLSPGGGEVLYRIIRDAEGHIWIAGGRTWYSGVIYRLEGDQLEASLRTDKALLGLAGSAGGTLAATGVDGHLWIKPPGGAWTDRHPQLWSVARGLAFYDDEALLVAGGNAFEEGYMFRVDQQAGVSAVHQHLNRLNDVIITDTLTALCAGYGILFRSEDRGQSWQILDVTGDHFFQMDFPTPQRGYAVGYSHSILQTTDGGRQWRYIREGQRWMTSGPPLLSVSFRDEAVGVVGGEGGTVWLTRDSGKKWTPLTGLPRQMDVHAVLLRGDTLLVAGSGGRFYRASLP